MISRTLPYLRALFSGRGATTLNANHSAGQQPTNAPVIQKYNLLFKPFEVRWQGCQGCQSKVTFVNFDNLANVLQTVFF